MLSLFFNLSCSFLRRKEGKGRVCGGGGGGGGARKCARSRRWAQRREAPLRPQLRAARGAVHVAHALKRCTPMKKGRSLNNVRGVVGRQPPNPLTYAATCSVPVRRMSREPLPTITV
jgi:hypothetical protein